MTEIEHTYYLRELRRKIVAHFNIEELQTLALDLSIDWDILSGEEKVSKVNSLVRHQAQRGHLGDLIILLGEERPQVEWPDIPPPEQQIEDEGEIVPDSIRETALQDYLQKMSTQVVDKRLPNGGYSPTTISFARAYTEAVAYRLDKRRLLVVIRFLAGISLAATASEWNGFDLSKVDLQGADLRGVDVRGANLSRTNLWEANLDGANLGGANLWKANLSGANLSGASLCRANLWEANLSGAELWEANLSRADLRGAELSLANLSRANLIEANLSGAFLIGAGLGEANLWEANLWEANLREANLRKVDLGEANLWEADLREADLRKADLHETNLSGANMSGANLSGANLRKADLREVKNWTIKQLEQTSLLEGAIMPDGSVLADGLTFGVWKAQYLAEHGGTVTDIRIKYELDDSD